MTITKKENSAPGTGILLLGLTLFLLSPCFFFSFCGFANNANKNGPWWGLMGIAMVPACIGIMAAFLLALIASIRRRISARLLVTMWATIVVAILVAWYALSIYRSPWI
jgi:hypothetical protein